MKLSKQTVKKLYDIVVVDSNQRLAEWEKYKNLEGDPQKNYDFEKTREFFPEGKFFDIENIEGFTGMFEGKFLIYFRGSDSLLDWIRNFTFFNLRARKIIPYKEKGTNKKIKVHRGFYRSYLTARDYIHEVVKEAVSNGVKEFVFLGHSKGAAVTSLAALDIQYNFDVDVAAVIGGSPKFGNKEFAESFNRRVPAVSFIYGNDLIPLIPFKWMGFRHVAEKNYVHIGPERSKNIFKLSKKWHYWNYYRDAIEEELPEGEYPKNQG